MTEPLLLALTVLGVATADGVVRRRDRRRRCGNGRRPGRRRAGARLPHPLRSVAGHAIARWPRRRGRAGGSGEPVATRVCGVSRAIAVYPTRRASSASRSSAAWSSASGSCRATSSCPRITAQGLPLSAAAPRSSGARAQLSGRGAGRARRRRRALCCSLLGVAVRRRASCAHAARAGWPRRPCRGWRFCDGHPFRIRYMVPLIAVEAVAAGASLAGRAARARSRVVLRRLAAARRRSWSRCEPPLRLDDDRRRWWSRRSGIVRTRRSRRAGHRCACARATTARRHGEHGIARPLHAGDCRATASALRDFLHEGNGDIWLAALEDPRPYAGWVLIEEKAEGGDMLAKTCARAPAISSTGYSRVCEGAGLALYERQNRMLNVNR